LQFGRFVSLLWPEAIDCEDPTLLHAASNQDGKRRHLLGAKKGKKNNQAAQAIDQSKFFGGGINQGQAASNQD
jgi:hypothetical protein